MSRSCARRRCTPGRVERPAGWSFFDLAYVLVVAQLASAFVDDLSWHGAGVFGGLFTAIWLSWVGFTLYANRFDTDDLVFRVIKLAATLAIAGCAASATEATGSLGWAFAVSFSPLGCCWSCSTRALGVLSCRRAERSPSTWLRRPCPLPCGRSRSA